MKQQINFRASALTTKQLEWLMSEWGTSQTETLTVVIDRIYQQESKMNKPVINQVFYVNQTGNHDTATDTYHNMTLFVLGEHFRSDRRPTTGPTSYGHVEDTPENRTLVEALMQELRAAEAGRNLFDNEPRYADGAKKTFRQIAEDFWTRNGKNIAEVFAPYQPNGEGMWTFSADLMLPEPLPAWWTNGEG